MRQRRGRVVVVETTADLDRRLADGAGPLGSWRVHGLDLRGRAAELVGRGVAGATFFDCRLAPGEDDALEAAGALLLPHVGDTPLDVYRARLYTADELYDATPYAASLDARAYAWSQRRDGDARGVRDDTLAAALHDHAIDVALDDWVADRPVVGVMGGHAADRGSTAYADAARLGRALGAAGFVVATGGGPGAMEAANLGARFSGAPPETLTTALQRLATAPAPLPSVDAWVAAARRALRLPHSPVATLGVPTWHYGHEPPNLAATAIAKYVGNAEREAVLLEICSAGVVFLPGAAGTVQEVFQDACENYYAEPTSVAPMVLVGRDHWSEAVPVWPALRALAAGRAMQRHVHLVDAVDEAAALLTRRG